jgi:transcriptional regulator with XRE-family HTH domain
MVMNEKETVLKELGSRVRELRKARGLTQEDLSERSGLHYTYIGGIERGERNPSLKSMKRVADALEVELDDLCIVHHRKGDTETSRLLSQINRALIDKDVRVLRLISLIVDDIDEWIKE